MKHFSEDDNDNRKNQEDVKRRKLPGDFGKEIGTKHFQEKFNYIVYCSASFYTLFNNSSKSPFNKGWFRRVFRKLGIEKKKKK